MDVHGERHAATVDLQAYSDAHITKRLVALLVALCSGRDAGTDAVTIIRDMGLRQHVTGKRSNRLRSRDRTQAKARRVVAAG